MPIPAEKRESPTDLMMRRKSEMEPTLYYGLSQMPFMKSSRYDSLFESEDLKNMKGRLLYLKSTRGIGLFTGNPGTGKTAALREFASGLNPASYKVIYLKLSSVGATEFLRMICQELGMEPKYRKADVFRQIQDEVTYLVNEKRCVPVLIIDEAQHLPGEILRDLVMLLNFDMDSKDYCIVILCGLPQLNKSLTRTVYESLRQRIIVNCHSEGLSLEEARRYIDFCLEKCDGREKVFSEDAIEAAWRNSQGSIRKLNTLLARSMIEGTNQKKRLIDSEIIAIAKEESTLA